MGGWIHAPIPELCNAIQITGQIPSRFYIIHLHVSLSNNLSFNVTLNFHCLLLTLCNDGCSGVLNRAQALRLHVLQSSQNFAIRERCQNFAIRERCHTQLKNETMDGNQGDHVTFVWIWRRSKQRFSFCRTFHQFIEHHDADTVHRRTLLNPDVPFLKQADWYGLLGFEF